VVVPAWGQAVTAWWTDLPDGSMVLDDLGLVLRREDGRWVEQRNTYEGMDEFEWREWVNDPTVTAMHVPVTDVEPPVGSIVTVGSDLFMRGDGDLWWDYVSSAPYPQTWKQIRPHATRILRWGA